MGAHPTVRLDVARLFDKGVSYENIARSLGIPREHVKQHVYMARSLGEIAEDHPRLRHKHGEKREAVYQHLLEGRSPQEIARLMGITAHGVHHHIRAMRANPKDRDQSVLCYRKPKSMRHVASRTVNAIGKRKGGINEFFQGIGDHRTVVRLCYETPRDMTVMEYAAKLVLDVYEGGD